MYDDITYILRTKYDVGLVLVFMNIIVGTLLLLSPSHSVRVAGIFLIIPMMMGLILMFTAICERYR